MSHPVLGFSHHEDHRSIEMPLREVDFKTGTGDYFLSTRPAAVLDDDKVRAVALQGRGELFPVGRPGQPRKRCVRRKNTRFDLAAEFVNPQTPAARSVADHNRRPFAVWRDFHAAACNGMVERFY